MRVTFEQLSAEYPVLFDRFCSDEREDRQNVMMMSCAVWAIERGVEVELRWDPDLSGRRRQLRAVFLVLFSVAAYQLKSAIERYRSREDCFVIVAGPHAVSFPEHCYRAGADAVVGRCNRDLFLSILDDLEQGRIKPRYHTEEPIAAFPEQADFRRYGLLPEQPFMNAVASTGCPYTCSFCSDATVGFAQQHVDAVLRNVASSDEPVVVWNDPLFGVGAQGAALLSGLRGIPGRYHIAFTTASLLVKPTFRQSLVEAGFVMVEVGVENINSPFAKNKNADFIKVFSECDFLVLVNYIYGLHEKDFDKRTLEFMDELTSRCPNVLPMVFVPFSLPDAPLHQENLARRKVFDPSYLCIGNEIMSMDLPCAMSPAEYYERLDGLNDRLYDGHNERMRAWIESHPRIDARRKEMLLVMAERQRRDGDKATCWSEILRQNAPDTPVPFAQKVLSEAVPGFASHDLCLE